MTSKIEERLSRLYLEELKERVRLEERVELLTQKVMLANNALSRVQGRDKGSFLDWIADRLVNQHKENENVDYVHGLRDRAKIVKEAIDEIRKLGF